MMGRLRFYLSQSLVLRLSLVILVPLLAFVTFRPKEAPMAEITEISGVKIERNPPESKLTELGVTTWSTWEGGPMKIPWTFNTGAETMYFLQGKVKVTVEGHDESFELEAGNLAVFPKDMSITWEVIEPLKKHYNVEE